VARREQPGAAHRHRHLPDRRPPRPAMRGDRVPAPVPAPLQPHLARPRRSRTGPDGTQRLDLPRCSPATAPAPAGPAPAAATTASWTTPPDPGHDTSRTSHLPRGQPARRTPGSCGPQLRQARHGRGRTATQDITRQRTLTAHGRNHARQRQPREQGAAGNPAPVPRPRPSPRLNYHTELKSPPATPNADSALSLELGDREWLASRSSVYGLVGSTGSL
jgi:hypothetical protein